MNNPSNDCKVLTMLLMIICTAGCNFIGIMEDVAQTTKTATESLAETSDSLSNAVKDMNINSKDFSDNIIRTSKNMENLTASLKDTTKDISRSTENIAISTKSMAQTASNIDNLTKSLTKTNDKVNKVFDEIDSVVLASKEMMAPLQQVSENSQQLSSVVDKTIKTADQVLGKVQSMSSDEQFSGVITKLDEIGSSVNDSLKNFKEISAEATVDYKNLRTNIGVVTDDLKKEAVENFDKLTDQIVKTLKDPYAYGPWVALFALLIIFYFLSTQSKRRFQKFIKLQGENFRRQSASFEVMQNLRDLSENISLDKWKNNLKTTVIKSNLLQVFEDGVGNFVQLTQENTPLIMHNLLHEIFITKKHELCEKNLQGVHLENIDLHGANFSKSDLTKAQLCDSSFAKAIFDKAILNEADLNEVDLQDASCKGAKMVAANLTGANLQGVNFAGANLKNANLQGANLTGANLKKANLSGVNLEGANLEGVNLEDANFSGTIFDNLSESKILLALKKK